MKRIFYIIALIILSCSSSDDSPNKVLPESYDIRIEIDGILSVPNIYISVNSTVVNEWENQSLPFNEDYTYNTLGNELTSTSCNCITIAVGAYLSSVNEMTSFKLYVDGELVDYTTVTNPTSMGFINPTRLEFVY